MIHCSVNYHTILPQGIREPFPSELLLFVGIIEFEIRVLHRTIRRLERLPASIIHSHLKSNTRPDKNTHTIVQTQEMITIVKIVRLLDFSANCYAPAGRRCRSRDQLISVSIRVDIDSFILQIVIVEPSISASFYE